MKNTLKYQFIVTLLFAQMVAVAQIEFSTEFQGREYSGSASIDKPSFNSSSSSGSNDRDRDKDRGSSSSSYSSNNSSSNNNYDWEERKREMEREREIERKRREKETKLINETNKMLNNDCIDIVRMQYVIDEFDKISVGYDGHEARAKLMSQKHNMTSIYNKYSLMAANIKDHSFGSINPRMMSLSYEDLDKFLKQFLNEKDFERAKIEYQKYEKAKMLDEEIDELYVHLNDKKYLRENYDVVENKMVGVRIVHGIDYVNNIDKLAEVKKVIELEEIKHIPLTISNIKTILASKKAAKSNADWKKIAKGMTSQRLLSVLGTLNSDNNNVLPDYVSEEGGYILFVGKPIVTDTKTITKEYLVSKDGSRIVIFETEGVVANDIVEVKATLGDNKASAKVTSDGDVENKVGSTVAKNAVSAKLTLMNTDWHKQKKKDVYSIDTDGTILQYGGESSVGLKANISGSANADINVPMGKTRTKKEPKGKSRIASADASVGAGVEVAHVGATLSGKWTPKMLVNPDGSISYRQYSASVEGGLSAGASAKVSVSKEGVSAKLGVVSMGVSFASQDIDGALKQIDSDVVLGIIKSSIDNEYYTNEYKDETIGKAAVSSIRKEIEIREKEVEKH